MLAQMMYSNMGYTIYRQVLGYYSGENTEDAYGMFSAPVTVSNCPQFHFADNFILPAATISPFKMNYNPPISYRLVLYRRYEKVTKER